MGSAFAASRSPPLAAAVEQGGCTIRLDFKEILPPAYSAMLALDGAGCQSTLEPALVELVELRVAAQRRSVVGRSDHALRRRRTRPKGSCKGMIDVRLKRAYEPAAASDGFRLLVDRLWPRR